MIENGKHYKEDQYWVSPYNFHPQVTGELNLPEKVEIMMRRFEMESKPLALSFLLKKKLRLRKSWTRSVSIGSRQECRRFHHKTLKRLRKSRHSVLTPKFTRSLAP